jgi:hypothetical protein
MQPNRLHNKQGLVNEHHNIYGHSASLILNFGLHIESIKFFLGVKLTTDEMLKIDKTVIAEVFLIFLIFFLIEVF